MNSESAPMCPLPRFASPNNSLPRSAWERHISPLRGRDGTESRPTGGAWSRTGLCLLLFLLTACNAPEKKPDRVEHLSGKTLGETIADHRAHLLSIPGVIRVEPGDCGIDSCIKVVVTQRTDMLTNQIPMMLETYQVQVVEGK